MGVHGAIEKKIDTLADETINWGLILIGVLLILVAVFVTNKWIKTAVLAWVVFP